MGTLTVTLPQSLIDRMDAIVRSTGLPSKMLDAAMDVMEPELKRRMALHVKTGELLKSVKRSKPRLTVKGVWRASIYFDGYDTTRKKTPSDPRGVPNDRKAMELEWGSSKQVAEPFIRPTKESKTDEAVDAMDAIFNKAVKP